MATSAAPGTAAIAFATAQGMVCDVLRADSTGTVHYYTLYTSYVWPVPDLFGPCLTAPEASVALMTAPPTLHGTTAGPHALQLRSCIEPNAPGRLIHPCSAGAA
jgi:hypothetical protein